MTNSGVSSARSDLRVLTVRQPWAHAILHLGKDVENRNANLGGYRGPLLIHAGQQMDLAVAAKSPFDGQLYFRGTSVRLPDGFGAAPGQMAARPHLHRGILGVVELVEIHGWRACLGPDGLCSEWAQAEAFHMVLANPRPFERPITHLSNGEPIRGRLGIWRLPAGALVA